MFNIALKLLKWDSLSTTNNFPSFRSYDSLQLSEVSLLRRGLTFYPERKFLVAPIIHLLPCKKFPCCVGLSPSALKEVSLLRCGMTEPREGEREIQDFSPSPSEVQPGGKNHLLLYEGGALEIGVPP